MPNREHARAGQGRSWSPALLAVALLAAACSTDKLLEVTDPQYASPGSLQTAAGVPTLVNGALSDFQVAYSGGGGDSYLSTASLITDELHSAGTFTTRTATDQRDQFPTVQGNTSDGAFVSLQQARRSLRDAAAAVDQFRSDAKVGATADATIAKLKALEGFTYVALGEAFCAPIPFSETVNGAPGDPGQPLPLDQVWSEAETRFDAALAARSDSYLAMVGKGRALLDAGDYAGAEAAVAAVPTSFVYAIEHSANSTRQQNPLYVLQQNGRYSVSDNEGGVGLDFRSADDPRVPWVQDPAGGFDKSIALYLDERYTDFSTPVTLADGIEARLIEAEAELKAGHVDTWLGKLNDLRANVGSLMSARYPDYTSVVPGPNNSTTTLDPLMDPGTADARLNLMFRERAFWLFTTGHRLGDLRRLIRQYGRPADSVFPAGAYFKGGQYGGDVNFPIPFDETNNPNYSSDMCSTTSA